MREAIKLTAFVLAAFAMLPSDVVTPAVTPITPVIEEPIVQPTPEVKPIVRHAEIDFYCGANCIWCERWKALIPGLRDAGWAVVECKADPGKAIPYFDVWLNGKSHRHNGYMSYAQLRAIIGEPAKPSVAVRGNTSVISASYRARWTYPAPLSSHLSGWPHNMSTSGMSHAEMLAAHDSCHDRIGPVNVAQLRAKSFGASCPSGNCPTSRQRVFGRLFR